MYNCQPDHQYNILEQIDKNHFSDSIGFFQELIILTSDNDKYLIFIYIYFSLIFTFFHVSYIIIVQDLIKKFQILLFLIIKKSVQVPLDKKYSEEKT